MKREARFSDCLTVELQIPLRTDLPDGNIREQRHSIGDHLRDLVDPTSLGECPVDLGTSTAHHPPERVAFAVTFQ
ncbi:hypothetical protein GQ85_06655 [Rhodococcus rhodochrous]|nr:hypothetical protein GQ85_06655 [Rhodococcus rhodochrous]